MSSRGKAEAVAMYGLLVGLVSTAAAFSLAIVAGILGYEVVAIACGVGTAVILATTFVVTLTAIVIDMALAG